ncbi:MAG: ferritin family protein [Desulfomonile tiedjei]|uniref:Ferritin family protein n=1 Tax=Desulfomonile tiedjei TaxID=2358 RepID=A0A9D6V7D1_9BACT|nr:ferritin family protein [Desulfomonile tiedjei]
MADGDDRSLRMVAAALEKEEKGRDFYKDASEKCSNELGRELFHTLMIEEGIHIKRIKQIYESLRGGGAWTEEWRSFKGINESLQSVVRERINKLGPKVQSVGGDLDAVEIGLQMEQSAINFYEEELPKASGAVEKEFIKKMIAEEHAHFASLADLKLYLTNPLSWFTEKESPSLDGA